MQERDGLGDNLPSDYLIRVQQGGCYGRPEGYYENFATGFWISGEERAEVWGRPAALAVAKDGSLLVADDTGGTIWRISCQGPPSEQAGAPAKNTGSDAKTLAGGDQGPPNPRDIMELSPRPRAPSWRRSNRTAPAR